MQKVFLIVCVCVLSALVAQKATEVQPVLDDVLMNNVEALAEMESEGPTDCWGSGNYTCPDYGVKVAFVYRGYCLEPDEETY